jgi:hypothetical protein
LKTLVSGKSFTDIPLILCPGGAAAQVCWRYCYAITLAAGLACAAAVWCCGKYPAFFMHRGRLAQLDMCCCQQSKH